MRGAKHLYWSSHTDKARALLEMEFDNDGRADRVGLIVDAAELDTLISNLGAVRSELKPHHPRKLEGRPAFRDITRGTEAYVGRPNAASQEIALAVLHPGFGWLCFPLSLEGAKNISIRLMQEVTSRLNQTPIVGPDGKPLG